MTKKKVTNVPASIRDRLFRQSLAAQEPFQQVLERFATDRLLYRMSASRHRDSFVVKGAFLLTAWGGNMYRPSRDLDFQGYGDNALEHVRRVFQEVARFPAPTDGLLFDADAIVIERILEEEEYQGVRLRIPVHLADAKIVVRVDVGFGDVISPAPLEITFPAMLYQPPAHMRGYPPETVIAQKFHAMVKLERRNGRMRDFRDVWSLARNRAFVCGTLATAIRDTFARRGTDLPTGMPLPLSDAFAGDAGVIERWEAYRNLATDVETLPPILDLVAAMRGFLMHPLACIQDAGLSEERWEAGGPWRRP